ncbi:MAG: OmpH family outer membrane protein [Terracidiphilus sp.]
MKRLFAIIVLLVSGCVLSATAQTSSAPKAPAGPGKIAVCSFQAAVGQTNEFQRDMADLEKKYEPRRQQLKVLADEIDNMEKQLKSQGDKISQTERAHRAKTIDEKKKQGQRQAEDLQNDVQGEMQEVFGKVAGKVYDVLSNYAQQQGYTLVLDSTVSRQQAPLILFSDQSTDISKTVLDAYNLKSGVPAPPAQPAAATPPASH